MMDQHLKEIYTDLKSYLEYLKSMGVFELPLAEKKKEKDLSLEDSSHIGAIHESSLSYDLKEWSQTEMVSLEEIRSELGDCKRCKLHRTRRMLVFGEGSKKARLMLIGEGPGYDEDVQGRPFVGKAGQLLTKILQSIEIPREEVYITNIIKCRPPQNRNPEPDEIESCHPFLLKQIQTIRPHIICALGTFAAQTLLRTDAKITALRGKVYDFAGIQLFPTYHPAYLLRNPEKKREVWEDMKLIAKALADNER
ncbi:MAG: uracil-DNA glycosylase [Deltaproteobacteria bacterium]|nr:uracil-DNA glycosylase [Deltaproteobacteria bacterium]